MHTKCGRAPGAPLHMLPQLLWRRKGVLMLLRNGPAPAHMGGNKLSIIRLCACARLGYGIYWPLMYYTIHGLVRNKSQGFLVRNVRHTYIKYTCIYQTMFNVRLWKKLMYLTIAKKKMFLKFAHWLSTCVRSYLHMKSPGWTYRSFTRRHTRSFVISDTILLVIETTSPLTLKVNEPMWLNF